MKKIYITLGIGLLILAAIVALIIYPYYGKITTLKQEMYDARVQLAIFQQQRSNAEATQQDYNRIKNDTDNISKIFINKTKIIDFISLLETTASKRGVKQTINLDAATQNPSSGILNMTISIDGIWGNCMNYLADVERLDYYVAITELNATESGQDINLVLTAQAFTQ